MNITQHRASTGLVEKYIGTAYDNVKRVSEELEAIINVSDALVKDVDFEVLANVLLNIKDNAADLASLAQADLIAISDDLNKGNFLGNRKIDINLAMNVQGITEELLRDDPNTAEALWTNPSNTVFYNKATATFVDGTVVELPFEFDGNPVNITTHGDLLSQFNRFDNQTAVAQEVTINNIVAVNGYTYRVTINGIAFEYLADADATIPEIVSGLVQSINVTEANGSVPVTAIDQVTSIRLVADVAGDEFIAYGNGNMTFSTTVANVEGGAVENPFLAKLESTGMIGIAADAVGEIVRFYDVTGENSNLERIQLHAVSGNYRYKDWDLYWAKTTSALQTLSMRAGDIIKLGNELDNIIILANSINEVLEVQSRIPQLVDTFQPDGTPNGDVTVYNKLFELDQIHQNLNALLLIFEDMKTGGNNYIQTVGSNISDVSVVASNIVDVQNAEENAQTASTQAGVATTQAGIATAAADTATTQAGIATTQAGIATTKSNEIKNVSVGSTITGASGSPASVVYNPSTGQFTFVVPQGVKGDRGEAFQVNAVGNIADRALYDTRTKGFSFLALDESTIYFKLSDTTGDWSLGAPFGKGEKGDTGDVGNGIATIVFTSTDHVSELAAQSGGTDTYTITFTDSTTTSFQVYNGMDSAVTSVAGRTGNVILNKSDVELDQVDNTSDINKPISSAVQTALNNKSAITDIRDLLTSNETDKPLSANQGRVLKGFIDNINTLLTSDDTTLDELQEIVDFIKQNKSTLDTLGISNIAGLQTALDSKQATLVSGTNIKTVNGESVLGSGNIITPTTTVENVLTSTSTTNALSAAMGKNLNDDKQEKLISGTNIKTINGSSVLGSGDLSVGGGGTPKSVQIFGFSGTWTKPAGITKVKVTVTGGGASGTPYAGISSRTAGGGAGGNSGATIIGVMDVTSITSVNVTVGAGGSSASNSIYGNAGGSSSFGSYLVAPGGNPGQYSVPSLNLPYPTNTSTVIRVLRATGASGGMGLPGSDGVGGQGAPSFFGGGLPGSRMDYGVGGLNHVYGSGGGGGASLTSDSNVVSSAGGNGIVIIEEYE